MYQYLLEITHNIIGGTTIVNDRQEKCRVVPLLEPLVENFSSDIMNSLYFGY